MDVRCIAQKMVSGQLGIHPVSLCIKHIEGSSPPRDLSSKTVHSILEYQWKTIDIIAVLDYVVISARLERSNRRFFITSACDDHNGEREVLLPYMAEKREAISIREMNVRQHQIIRSRFPLQAMNSIP